jgi:Mce-associated membrane protein
VTEDTRGLKTSEEPDPTENTEAIDTDTDTEPDDSVTDASGDDEAAADAPADEDDEAAADATDEEATDAEADSDAEAEADADDDAKVDAKAEAKAAKAETKAAKPKPTPKPTPKARANRPRRDLWRWTRNLKPVPVILVLLLLTSAGVATWVYFERYQPNRQTDPGVAEAVVSAASEGTVALLSYSPESLDKDFANAKSHLSGDFLSYYNQFTEQIVAPAAKQKSLKTTAHVMRAGISEMHADSAVVLLFVDQSTTSKDNPDPAMSASSVQVTVTRVDGQWLITKFTPV